jgi:protease II
MVPPAKPPPATQQTTWGDTRVDENAWMRDTQSAALADWVRVENEAFARQTAGQSRLRVKLAAERSARMPSDRETMPVRQGNGLWF